MGCPSGGKGPSRKRDRNSTCRSGSRRRGGGGEGRERSEGERGGCGGGGVGQREQWEDPLATQPDRELELSQTNRGVGGVCVGVVPRVQSKLSRSLHAHRGKKLLQDLQTQESAAKKRAMVTFRVAREKGAMAFVECLGFSQEDTMEGLLWREALGRRAWGRMARRNLLVGCAMVMIAGKKPLASTPYLAQRRDGALSLTIGCSTRHWHDPFARVKSSLWLKTHGPSDRELANKTAD